MHLDAVTFPALLISDDGWVQHLSKAADLAMWKRSAVMKYKKRGVVLYDSKDNAWRIENIVPHKPMNLGTKLLAHTFHNPKVPVMVEIQPITETPPHTVQELLRKAIDADDDILTQETEPGELKTSVQKPISFKKLVAELKKSGAL